MLQSAWLFVGTIAFLWTLVTIFIAAYADPDPGAGAGEAMATIGGVVGFILWGVWTFGALNITVVGDSTTFSFSHPELAILGVAMALVPGYIALTGPVELVKRARDTRMDQV